MGTAATGSMLRAYPFTTTGCSVHGRVDGHAVASGGLGGAGRRRPTLRFFLAATKGAAAVAHGVAHLLLLVADARKLPGDRAAQG